MSTEQDNLGYDGDASAEDLLRWAFGRYHPRIAVATSLQDVVLVHMAIRIQPAARIFSIDTGRLPEETYQCAEALRRMFGVLIEWHFPRTEAVERLEREKGAYSFRESLDARRECCAIRKVEPLHRALEGLDAWVTGMRREDGATREGLPKLQRDEAHRGILKVNPLADWTADQVRGYTRRYGLPYNRLMDSGYASVGCACCTRPIEPGQDPRAGRWWWENPEHKECGLHTRNRSI